MVCLVDLVVLILVTCDLRVVTCFGFIAYVSMFDLVAVGIVYL